MRVLISGGSGFIGTHLCEKLKLKATPVSLRDSSWPEKIACVKPKVVVHLAGHTHDGFKGQEIWRCNVDGTKALAEEAIRHGVKRFIFLSSIQAVLEKDAGNRGARADETPVPRGAYGRSKMVAEELLRRLSLESRMEVVIIRAPLVYGPKVKANFRNLFQLVDRRVPLPLSCLDSNCRSFVGVSNVVDLILLCLEHPAAANQTFHVSDDEDVSTAEMVRRMGRALGKPARNLAMPRVVLKTCLQIIGKAEWAVKLWGDLKVDISETKRLLGWKPRVTMEEELERTANWWRESRQGQF